MGTHIERVLVDNGTYDGRMVGVSDVYAATDFNGKEVEKLRIDVETDKGILPYFVAAVISDAGERNQGYRNSNLYGVLVKADVLDPQCLY